MLGSSCDARQCQPIHCSLPELLPHHSLHCTGSAMYVFTAGFHYGLGTRRQARHHSPSAGRPALCTHGGRWRLRTVSLGQGGGSGAARGAQGTMTSATGAMTVAPGAAQAVAGTMETPGLATRTRRAAQAPACSGSGRPSACAASCRCASPV